MPDWTTISSLATAGGTLVLAVATFSSVRSANRAARAAEQSVLAGLRPLVLQSHPTDETQKIMFADEQWLVAAGGCGAAEVVDGVVYLAISLRNVGSGLAILHSWTVYGERRMGQAEFPDLPRFRPQYRDLYIPASDIGFWQGALREVDDPDTVRVREAVLAGTPLTVDLLYGDAEGGQRIVTRFGLTKVVGEETGTERWIASASRHWNLDRPDPR